MIYSACNSSLTHCCLFTDIVPMMKPRSQTFSYSSTSASPDRLPMSSRRLNTHTTKDMRTGILPSFVFLQLYHMNLLHTSNLPLPIPDGTEVSTGGTIGVITSQRQGSTCWFILTTGKRTMIKHRK